MSRIVAVGCDTCGAQMERAIRTVAHVVREDRPAVIARYVCRCGTVVDLEEGP